MMKYLCVDIEWNVPADKAVPHELLSLGAQLADTEEGGKIFFRYIRPERMEAVTFNSLRLLSVGVHTLEQAKPAGQVLANFCHVFPRWDCLVVWSRRAAELLRDTLERYGYGIRGGRCLVLQEFLDAVRQGGGGREIGFAEALAAFRVPYRRELLHNSKYDVLYLRQLYEAAARELLAGAGPPALLVHTRTSGILHHPACRYVAGRQTWQGSWADALAGQPICRCCAAAGRLRALPKPRAAARVCPPAVQPPKPRKKPAPVVHAPSWKDERFDKPIDEEKLSRYCRGLGMDCVCAQGWVFLRTPAAFWKIGHNGYEAMTVLHQSLRVSKRAAERCAGRNYGGYHQQAVYTRDIFKVVRYIYEHDRHFLQPGYIPSYYAGSIPN